MTVGVIGYGSQGTAIARNLQDSGWEVIVGLREDSKSRERAQADGIKLIKTISATVQQSDVVVFAFPDHLHGVVYRREIKQKLVPGSILLFLHGLSVHFALVEPPDDVDVIMIAPHGPGVALRQMHERGESDISAFSSVHQDSSGTAEGILLSLAMGIGLDPEKLVLTTFEDEAVGDMFGEQAVLCGGMAAMIKNGFEVLVENGIPPENAYLEVAYQLDLIISLIKQHGITGMFDRISLTARYGSLKTGPYLVDEGFKNRMRDVFEKIRSGEFVSELTKLQDDDIKQVDKDLARLTDSALEKAAKKFAK